MESSPIVQPAEILQTFCTCLCLTVCVGSEHATWAIDLAAPRLQLHHALLWDELPVPQQHRRANAPLRVWLQPGLSCEAELTTTTLRAWDESWPNPSLLSGQSCGSHFVKSMLTKICRSIYGHISRNDRSLPYSCTFDHHNTVMNCL